MTVSEEKPIGGRHTDDLCQRIDDTHHRVDGRELSLPMSIADCSLVLHAYTVPAKGVAKMLEGTDLTPGCVLPGTAVLLLMGVDYRDNPLGNYNEVAVLVSAYPPGPQGPTRRNWMSGAWAGLQMAMPFYVVRMPVDQEFTTHAGRHLWGYPKYVANIDIEFAERTVGVRLVEDGEPVVAFEAPAVAADDSGARDRGTMSERAGNTLTLRHGVLRSIAGTFAGRGVSYRLGGSPPQLSEHHPLALQLRALGLPKRPLVSASIAHVQMTFGVPEVLSQAPTDAPQPPL